MIDPDTQEEISTKKACRKTWFGYWRDDGFEKTKHLGGIDLYDRWQGIKARWLEHYLNNEVHTGESVTAFVTDNDEWVAEAYLETDYSKITRADFEQVVREFALFQLLGAEVGPTENLDNESYEDDDNNDFGDDE
ncbi:TPA: hypothetical protein ACKN5L_000074 [Neisseria gonorrhoeae]